MTYGVGENAKIFGTEEEGKNLTEHLKRLTDLAGSLGADSMSFGSPDCVTQESLVASRLWRERLNCLVELLLRPMITIRR